MALSRAREGLYILGNSDDLLASGSEMWKEVIDQFQRSDQIGPYFPLSCSRHPGTIVEASEPGDIAMYAPDGNVNAVDHNVLALILALQEGVSKIAMLAYNVDTIVIFTAIPTIFSIELFAAFMTASGFAREATLARSLAQSHADPASIPRPFSCPVVISIRFAGTYT